MMHYAASAASADGFDCPVTAIETVELSDIPPGVVLTHESAVDSLASPVFSCRNQRKLGCDDALLPQPQKW